MTVQVDAIPSVLKERPQWVCWRQERRVDKKTGEVTQTKVPYTIEGKKASTTDPSTWASFDDAIAQAYRFDGVGFVLSKNDPFVGIDLDNAGLEGLDPWAEEIVTHVQSYAELSPSGVGVHIFLDGKLPPTGRTAHLHGEKIEMYSEGRYLTVTGKHIVGTPATIEPRQAELDALHARVFGVPNTGQVAAALPGWGTSIPINLTDDALYHAALDAKNGEKFRALWSGEVASYLFDDSSADLALCNMLAFWTGADASRIDRLFRQSGLMRAKWDEKRGETTYGAMTIAKALATTTETYNPPAIKVTLNGRGKVISSEEIPTPSVPHSHTYPLTDIGNAERLLAAHGADLRYCRAWHKWLVWDGKRFAVGDDGTVTEKAIATVRTILGEAEGVDDEKRRASIVKWALTSESKKSLDAMISIASDHAQLWVEPEQLDADGWLLNTHSGTVNLQTGQVQSFKQSDLITKLAPITIDPTAACPTWMGFLSVILPDPQIRSYVQKAAGYSLTGQISERVMQLLYGSGANGKSTFISTMAELLGDYACRTPTETLLIKKEAGIPNDIARLKGARFVYASEADEGKRLAESLVKDLTGGERVTARFLHGEFFDFTPCFKLWLGTNHKPVIRGTERAIWDRLRLVPFDVTIPEEKRIPRHLFIPQLVSELPGIFNWALAGCLAWGAEGLNAPAGVVAAMADYRDQMDVLVDFLEEECTLDLRADTLSKDVYHAYSVWCEANGERPLGHNAFGLRLQDKGCVARRVSGGGRAWRGIGLRREIPRGNAPWSKNDD